MSVATEPLHAEHETLISHVEHIRAAAAEVPALSPEERHVLVDRIVHFLHDQLAPHAEAEERSLYPHVARLLHDERATATMSYDHVAIRQRTDRLAEASVRDVPLLQELLYGLYALIIVHFEKEEELYLPLLYAEDPDGVGHVAAAMREIELERRHPHHSDL